MSLQEKFSLVLYDVTTLYFESFKEYDFQKPGFSKDNKPQQPQIVIGLITTRSGFPVMHEVFEGNTFEGHTMLDVVHRFQERVGETKPVIVADAAHALERQHAETGEERIPLHRRGTVGEHLAAASLIRSTKNCPVLTRHLRRFSYSLCCKECHHDLRVL